MLPPVYFRFEQGQRDAPRLFPFQTGGTVMPSVYFRLERGQRDSSCPLFLFVLNRGSVIPTRCPLFLFVSNGGSVIPTRCPPFLFILNGAGVILHAALFLFVSNGGGVIVHTALVPVFLGHLTQVGAAAPLYERSYIVSQLNFNLEILK